MHHQVSKMMKDYPRLIREREALKQQLMHFRGISCDEVIESMMTSNSGNEPVQTSRQTDKTERIAMSYQEKTERMNREWYDYLERKYHLLDEEITFFEAALDSLPEQLPALMRDMIIHGHTWDSLCEEHHVSRSMLAKHRNKAIEKLSSIYQRHDEDLLSFMLS